MVHSCVPDAVSCAPFVRGVEKKIHYGCTVFWMATSQLVVMS